MKHLESNNILYDFQHGFRANTSCEYQILSIIHQLSLNNDTNIQTDLINMDFGKAFAKVPHNRLLYNYKLFWCMRTIKSFLSNRTQTVILENHSSDNIPVTFKCSSGHCISSNTTFDMHQ